MCPGVLWRGYQLLKRLVQSRCPGSDPQPLRTWSTDPAQGHGCCLEINTRSQRAVLPGGAGLTAGRDNMLLELPKVSVQVPAESGASPSLTALETWETSPDQGGAALGICLRHGDITLTPPWTWISKPGHLGSTARTTGRAGKGEAWPHARQGVWPLWVANGFSGCWGMLGNVWLPTAHPALKTRCC